MVRTKASLKNGATAESLPAKSTLDVQHGIDNSTTAAATPVDKSPKTRQPQANRAMTEAAPILSTASSNNAPQGAANCHRRSDQGLSIPAGALREMPSLQGIKAAVKSSSPMHTGTLTLGNGSTTPDNAASSTVQAGHAGCPDDCDGSSSPVSKHESPGRDNAGSATINRTSATDNEQAMQHDADQVERSSAETRHTGGRLASRADDEASRQQLLQQLQRQQIMDAAHLLPGPADLLITDLMDHR